MIKAYKYRIYPTNEQADIMLRTIGSARKTYNLILDSRIDNYNEYKNGNITLEQMHKNEKSFTPAYYKKQEEYSYLKEVDSQALTQSVNHLNNGYKNFYRNLAQGKKPGHPKHKTRSKSKWSYSTCTTNNNIRLTQNKKGLILPKIPGVISLRYHREHYGVITKATITKTKSSKWYVSLTVRTDEPEPTPLVNEQGYVINKESFMKEARVIGLDLGLIDLVTGSDGSKTGNPKYGYKLSKKLAKEQRKLANKRKHIKRFCDKNEREVNYSEWSNYEKQREKVARVQEHIRNQRLDYLHKLSTSIVNTHDIISIETLRVQNLVKNHNLARSIHDAGWSIFITLLSYKAFRTGKILVKCDPFFPSSQLCSECEKKSNKKTLDVREWVCSGCEAILDRDVNAAMNILREGLRTLGFTESEIVLLLEPVGYRG